ncbi:MAG: hydroxymyristoyl-ACP dehydratase [Flavobacterium sp.]|nr:MAG: hydroxymyristoyl-ACP dehydratase [Flavobacterium sp.]
MNEFSHIVEKLPYGKEFLFVDQLLSVDENGVTGKFKFDKNFDFYEGHFVNNPITPGVILTECMAQIGVVCLGIFLIGETRMDMKIALTSTEMEFLKPVAKLEEVIVKSEKIYFRFNKLKCRVTMYNSLNEEVCTGTISGMISS